MSDFFLSYAHEDLEAAATLARLLEANGLSVWWDRRMVPGDKFHTVIDQELERAKAVIVLWSPTSVTSDWVLGEAQTAREMDKLVPIKISECKLPIPYRSFHTPEIYKTATELDQLAQLLSEKFKPAAQASGSPVPAPPPQIKFSAESSRTLLQEIAAQTAAFNAEVAELSKDKTISWWERNKKMRQLKKKYPWSPLGSAVTGAAMFVLGIVILIRQNGSAWFGPDIMEIIRKLFGIGIGALILFLVCYCMIQGIMTLIKRYRRTSR